MHRSYLIIYVGKESNIPNLATKFPLIVVTGFTYCPTLVYKEISWLQALDGYVFVTSFSGSPFGVLLLFVQSLAPLISKLLKHRMTFSVSNAFYYWPWGYMHRQGIYIYIYGPSAKIETVVYLRIKQGNCL